MFFLDTDHSFLCLVVVIVFETWCRTCFINIISFGCLYDCLFFSLCLFVCYLPQDLFIVVDHVSAKDLAAGFAHNGSKLQALQHHVGQLGEPLFLEKCETRTQNGLYM